MKKIINLNTYFKLLLLIIGTSVLFFLFYTSLYIYTTQQEKHVYKTTFTQYNNEVNSLFKLNSKTHIATITDVTYWNDLVKFTKTKDEKWFEKYIVGEFDSYEVDYIGVYDLNTKLISKIATSKIKTIDLIPKEILPQLYKSKLIRFYMKVPEGVVEVFGATIHPSNDPKKNKYKPSGYFFMVRLLDNQYFKNLEKISSSKVSLLTIDNPDVQSNDFITADLELKDLENNVVANLIFKRPFNLNFKNTKEILSIIIIASIINLLIYLYYSRRWVYNPLKLITNILESGNERSISSLKKAPGEFGYIGNLFEENNHQRKQLEISKQKAEESDKLKSSFLANLSHEIRTPMNAIIGFSDLLNNSDLTEDNKFEYLRIIKNSGSNLVSIIEDLIEMSKIDANQITPKFTGIDLDKCILELYKAINVTIPKDKEIDFTIIECPKPAQKNILTDEIKLKQIIINLITNAIKYTDKGHVAFGYEVNEKMRQIEFTVTDSGIGINEENLKIIFDRFRRIEDDFSVELSGLGLGLAISKAYVEMLGGTMSVESTEKIGSIFSFTIPLEYDNSERKSTSTNVPTVSKISKNQTILIAEDDNINFLLLKKILELKGHTIIRASNGQEAVDICNNNRSVSMVFMDIKMPVLDGYEAYEKIKITRPKLPAVAQTAHSSMETREKVAHAGFIDCITKPLDKEKIYQLLDSIFHDE